MINIIPETNKSKLVEEIRPGQEVMPGLEGAPEALETSPVAEKVVPTEEVGESEETGSELSASPEIIESAGLGGEQPVAELDDAAKATALAEMINGHGEEDPYELAEKAGLG